MLALAFSVLLVAVFATTISPGMAQQVDLRGTSVIRYRVGADVPPGPKQVVKGSRTSDGGCQFRSPTLGVSTAGQRVTATEIAYDPSLCESLIVITTQAVPPEEMAANREGYEYQDSRKYGPGAPDEYASTVPPAFPHPTGGDHPASMLTGHYGYYQSWFEDPVPPGYVDVNKVRDYVDWSEDGSCTYNQSGWHSLSWLAADGWHLNGASVNVDWECSRVQTATYAHFQNDVFCAFTSTHTYYQQSHGFGWYNGVLNGYTVWGKSGLCAFLLSHNEEVVKYW